MTLVRRLLYLLGHKVDTALGTSYPAVSILCYHSIARDNWYFSTDPQDFISQIKELQKTFQFISYHDLAQYLEGVTTFEKPALLLTFDDGYENIRTIAPFLADEGIQPIAFVLAQPNQANHQEMENSLAFLTPEQLKELLTMGWTIGCHTATHSDLLTASPEEITREIIQSKQLIENATGKDCQVIAYPKGRYTPAVLQAVKQAGYRHGFSMDDGILTPSSPRFTLPRVGVNRSHSLAEIRALPSVSAVKIRKLLKTFL